MDPERLVFLDVERSEGGAATSMVPTRGWACKGERLRAYAPHGHWKTSTLVMGLRKDELVAPLVIPCPMNGAIFRQYVEEMLVPTLAPGDIVILDNLSSHKSDAVRAIIEAAGAELLFLPPYSPDLNPRPKGGSRSSQSSNAPCAVPPNARAKPSGTRSDA